MVDLIQILSQEGASLVREIQDNLSSTGKNATGQTSRTTRFEVTKRAETYRLQIIGRPYFMVVETGRRPTPDKKPSRSMIDNIRAWLAAEGKEQSLVWAVATSIQKRGTALFRQGGRKDIVSNVITPGRIAEIEEEILLHFGNEYISQIKTVFNGGNRSATSPGV